MSFAVPLSMNSAEGAMPGDAQGMRFRSSSPATAPSSPRAPWQQLSAQSTLHSGRSFLPRRSYSTPPASRARGHLARLPAYAAVSKSCLPVYHSPSCAMYTGYTA